MTAKGSKLESLHKILRQEKAGGFRDETVIGGLDRFLQRWSGELATVLEGLGSYSVLTPEERESWANRVLANADGAGATEAPNREQVHTTPPPRTRARKAGESKSRAANAGLDAPVGRLKGIAKQNLSKLKRLGVEKVGDLVYLFPNRHNDFANIGKVSDLTPGRDQTVLVTVWEASESRQGPKRRSTEAVLGDETGNVRAIWFNNPYLAKTFRSGTNLVISGRVGVFRGNLVFESPEYELLQDQEELVHTGRLVPVYPMVSGLPQRTLRRAVKRALDIGIPQLVEFQPRDSRHRTGLMGLKNAVSQMHYPDTAEDWQAARRRLAFDELLMLQLAVLVRKRDWRKDEGIPLRVDSVPLDSFLRSLPFSLTAAQSSALKEILDDMGESRPMSRLLQGDVGSGKTVVAAAALFLAASSGHQAALMAPTEILAEQHFLSIPRLFPIVQSSPAEDHLVSVQVEAEVDPITIGLLIGSMRRKAKADMQRQLAEGQVDLVIGTHALVQQGVEIPKLALAIVDEQHRFGVMQRASLRGKGRRPHLLAMSATPIPRSLALTLYGDLDVSVIDEMPPGRQSIRTRWVEPEKRAAVYGFVRKEVEQRRQAFIVCPLVDESEAIQSRAATEEYERLSRDVFPDLRLGLLHGRMALREKEHTMGLFQRGELDILVSTPVVEVGIDVPNATVMLVDGAERFGLSQLHQFRGRVGRGHHQSYCMLLADSPGHEARERLGIVERVQDGFELAEEDLRIRGPGDYLGTRQSGLPDLKVARITDHDILTLARREAMTILDSDPDLSKKQNALLGERMRSLAALLAGEMS